MPKKSSASAAGLDRTDRRILRELQRDCAQPLVQLSERLRLSQAAIWQRIRKLEQAGVILARVALVDPAAVGLGMTAFALVRTSQHNTEWLERFSAHVLSLPEVLGFYRMSGHFDYFIRVVVSDIAAYDGFYKRLIAYPGISEVTSFFAMEVIRETTALPLAEA